MPQYFPFPSVLFDCACIENKQAIADIGKLSGVFDRGGVSVRDCPELDFAAARTLNKEGVARFVYERSVIAALNDRLAGLIDVVSNIKIFTSYTPECSAG